jgi:hypothetical protein
MMANPSITGFTAGANIGINSVGMNSYNGSSNWVYLTGSNMSQGLPVNVTNNAGVSWSGNLSAYNPGMQQWPATLACTNTSSGLGDSQDLDVTVGSGNEISNTYKANGVTVVSVSPVDSKRK